MTTASTDVLIIGAGPTGLFLALLLAKFGVRFRIVDAAAEAGTTSRALAVQARTLEFYRQVGLADDVVKRGLVLNGVNLWRNGERAMHIELGDAGRGASPFPYGLIFPQDEHERLLLDHLERAGVRVERQTTINALEQTASGTTARGRGPDGSPVTFAARYVAGCDGARSVARTAIGAGFPGGTYEHTFYVADVLAHGAPMNQELHVFLDEEGFLGLFPLLGEGRARLVGTVRGDPSEGRELSWDDADRRPLDRIGLQVEHVNWFSTYRVHHRVADSFRKGNVFLLGDAGHIHSPVGGQGMNTGLGDAMNLAWKLAALLGGRARADVLDTYEPERIAFARKLVKTTDRVFTFTSSSGAVAEVMRTQVVPRVLDPVLHTRFGKRMAFAALSQTGIAYRTSAWSRGRAGSVHAGDRLPWIEPAAAGGDDNFTPLTSLDWQVHVYGTPEAGLAGECEARKIALHPFPFDARAAAAKVESGAAYLVRPDGYLGGVFTGAGAARDVARYLQEHEIVGR